jgi:hypothetical protein
MLTALVVLGELILTVLGQMNCSAYSVDNSTDSPIAYKWFPPGTVNTGASAFADARTFCQSQCAEGCQLAIVRNLSTVSFLYSLQAIGLASAPGWSHAFIGLTQNSSGTWLWLDGQVCNYNSSSDKRCYGKCTFDNSGQYAGLIQSWDSFDDFLAADGDGSFICEVNSKFSCPSA